MHQMNLWATSGVEPSLSELFADPILHLVLRRDRITLAEVHAAVGAAQCRLRAVDCAGRAPQMSAA